MVNKVTLIGNVGLDPEVRSLEGGVKMARIRIATTERIFNRQTQEAREHTEWHTVILWRGMADVVDRYVRKGSQVYIEGRLRSREWEDQSGVKRYTTEVIADELKLLGRKPEGAPAGNYTPGPGSTPSAPVTTPTPDTPPNTEPPATPIPEPPQPAGSDPDDLPF